MVITLIVVIVMLLFVLGIVLNRKKHKDIAEAFSYFSVAWLFPLIITTIALVMNNLPTYNESRLNGLKTRITEHNEIDTTDYSVREIETYNQEATDLVSEIEAGKENALNIAINWFAPKYYLSIDTTTIRFIETEE